MARSDYSAVIVPVMSGWTSQMNVYVPAARRVDVVRDLLLRDDLALEHVGPGAVLDRDVVRGVFLVVQDDRDRLVGRDRDLGRR